MATLNDPAQLARMAVFAEVVGAGSLSEAARRLGISKSAVSRQLAELERRLGTRLLLRSTRSLRTTEAGRLFYEACQQMLQQARRAEEVVAELEQRLGGTLRVNAPVAFGRRRVAPVLAELLRQHPSLRAELTLEDRRIDPVREGYDVVVRITRMADSALVGRRLGAVRSLLVASPAYLERHGAPQRPEELGRHVTLDYTLASRPGRWVLHGDGQRLTVALQPRLLSNSGEALLELARAGLGITRLPSFFVEGDLRAGTLRRVLPGWEAEGSDVWVLMPQGRRPSAAVRAFVDRLTAELQGGSDAARRAGQPC